MKSLVLSHNFSLAGLAIACFCGSIWYFNPLSSWWPFLLAISPWLIKWLFGRRPISGTPLDYPILLFFVTACVGVWAAYNQTAGWAKYWIIVGGIVIFYAVAQQPHENLLPFAVFLSGFCAFVAIYFILTHNWVENPADLSILNKVGAFIIKYRPKFSAQSIHPNFSAGLIAVFMPISFSLGKAAWDKKHLALIIWAAITGGLGFTGLILSSSRAAWVALAIPTTIIVLRILAEKFQIRRTYSFRGLFLFAVVMLLLAGVGLIIAQPNFIALIGKFLPGPNSAVSRLEIYKNTLRLIAATPFTGGGLGSFPGLYSQYILDLPVFIFGYSHNLYLDIGLEQGYIGLLSFLTVVFLSIYFLLTDNNRSHWHWAILCGILVLILHGLADDSLYGNQGTPLFLVLPGMAIAVRQSGQKPIKFQAKRLWKFLGKITGVFIFFFLLLYFSNGNVRANWYSNTGAIEMAKIELANFPTEKWDEGQNTYKLRNVEKRFAQALTEDHRNITALYRLGRITMLKRNYSEALIYLENAYYYAPGHRGVIKTLGYCYVWTGLYENATNLLVEIPEARNEILEYSKWWRTQDREDLAERALEMLAYLEVNQIH